MSTVKLGWHRKTVPEKIIKGEYIVQQMTANAGIFVTPLPALADVTTAHDNLIQTAVAAEAGGTALTLAKNNAEDAYDALIAQLMSYVQNVSNGDEAIILQSGMDVRRTPSPLPPPAQVQNLDAFPSRTQGEINLNWGSLGNSYYYQVEQFIEDETGLGVWVKLVVSSKSKYTVTGLATGSVNKFRVAGIGRDDVVGPFSQEATSVAP